MTEHDFFEEEYDEETRALLEQADALLKGGNLLGDNDELEDENNAQVEEDEVSLFDDVDSDTTELSDRMASNDMLDSFEDRKRKLILKIVDPKEIGDAEYPYFLNYSVANVYHALTTSFNVRLPSNEEVQIMAKDALSKAFATHDLAKAEEYGAAFVTHLGWKCKEAAKTYVREVAKANKNIANVEDDSFGDARESSAAISDVEGDKQEYVDVDAPDEHNMSKLYEKEARKIEYAMRHVRWELPRESNIILDIGLGEKTKADGTKFNFIEWADYTNQNIDHVRRLHTKAKSIIKKKLIRKGFYEVISDIDKSVEDFEKDTRIQEEIKARQESESIIESSDVVVLQDLHDEIASDVSAEGLMESHAKAQKTDHASQNTEDEFFRPYGEFEDDTEVDEMEGV